MPPQVPFRTSTGFGLFQSGDSHSHVKMSPRCSPSIFFWLSTRARGNRWRHPSWVSTSFFSPHNIRSQYTKIQFSLQAAGTKMANTSSMHDILVDPRTREVSALRACVGSLTHPASASPILAGMIQTKNGGITALSTSEYLQLHNSCGKNSEGPPESLCQGPPAVIWVHFPNRLRSQFVFM